MKKKRRVIREIEVTDSEGEEDDDATKSEESKDRSSPATGTESEQ